MGFLFFASFIYMCYEHGATGCALWLISFMIFAIINNGYHELKEVKRR